MERIQNILQRLQELYYAKHAKSVIDLDLMLDYTRVLYADLLEWRKNVPLASDSIPSIDAPAKVLEAPVAEQESSSEDNQSYPAIEHQPDADDDAKEVDENIEAMDSDDDSLTGKDTPVESDSKESPTEVEEPVEEKGLDTPEMPTSSVAESPNDVIEEPLMINNLVEELPEQQTLGAIKDGNGISIELPSSAPIIDHVDEAAVVEQPSTNEPIEVVGVATPSIAEAIPKPVDLFSAHIPVQKDVRSLIGINDKYLFLNELFNNHKSEYEESLDRLNKFESFNEAYEWLLKTPASNNKWEIEDDTVQAFLSVLKRYFSEAK
jgi:hypothetical protein